MATGSESEWTSAPQLRKGVEMSVSNILKLKSKQEILDYIR